MRHWTRGLGAGLRAEEELKPEKFQFFIRLFMGED